MGTWFDDLEARLNQQLEAFLQANPAQQTRLEQQEARDRQERLNRDRLQLQQQAQELRQSLLLLAGEIRQWQARSSKARAAGASDLAARAEAHLSSLMLQGRQQWQQLAERGARFAAVEAELEQLKSSAQQPGSQAASASSGTKPPAQASTLEAEWAAFEAEQALQHLKRQQQR
ncbi:MAG: hercynine metabolism protein [Cyanobacteriota bacterium]|nr:hercynine metabolism protein [Cyanobacteriota bacterium]